MTNSINNKHDNLADIVGMNAITEPVTTSPLFIIIITILITSILLAFYYRFMHGFKGQLRHLIYQLQHSKIETRIAVHQLASLLKTHRLTDEQCQSLKVLRFSENEPSATQIIEFINHVE